MILVMNYYLMISIVGDIVYNIINDVAEDNQNNNSLIASRPPSRQTPSAANQTVTRDGQILGIFLGLAIATVILIIGAIVAIFLRRRRMRHLKNKQVRQIYADNGSLRSSFKSPICNGTNNFTPIVAIVDGRGTTQEREALFCPATNFSCRESSMEPMAKRVLPPVPIKKADNGNGKDTVLLKFMYFCSFLTKILQ